MCYFFREEIVVTEDYQVPASAVRSGKVTAVASLVAALTAGGCNYYSNPYVDLVLRVADDAAALKLDSAIRRFADQRQLVRSPASLETPLPEANRRIAEKTTYYLTGNSRAKGRSLVFFDASTDCKAVRLIEESPDWNEQSQAALAELRAELSAIEGVTVEQGHVFDGRSKDGGSLHEYCPGSMN